MYLKRCLEMRLCAQDIHSFTAAGFGVTLIFFFQHICSSKCSRMNMYYFWNGKKEKSYLKINK